MARVPFSQGARVVIYDKRTQESPMDYSKSGNPKLAKDGRRHVEHNQKGQAANPYGRKPNREDLLARMKAATEKAKEV